MLVIILYYANWINWIKWTSTDKLTAYSALDKSKLTLHNLINFNKDDQSTNLLSKSSIHFFKNLDKNSNKNKTLTQAKRLLPPSQENLFLDANHSNSSLQINTLNQDTINSKTNEKDRVKNANNDSVLDSAIDSAIDSKVDSKIDSELYKEIQLNSKGSELNLNKLNLNPTKASLQESYKLTTDYSISTQNLSSNKQIDQNEKDVNELKDLDQQEQKISESVPELTIRYIQVVSSKHKVELKIDNQIVSYNPFFLFC